MSNQAKGTEKLLAMVPVTTTDEMLLSDEERFDMVASLKAAEARIAAGSMSSMIRRHLWIV